MEMNKGLFHIYTGDGKGKTTAVVGLAARALGHKKAVLYSYCHKKPEKHGFNEINILKAAGAAIYGFAKRHPLFDRDVDVSELKLELENGIKNIKKIVEENQIELLVIDEIINSLNKGFVHIDTIKDFISNKPESLEIIFTGRSAPDELVELADYVSEIRKVKHPFDKKISAREGIEY